MTGLLYLNVIPPLYSNSYTFVHQFSQMFRNPLATAISLFDDDNPTNAPPSNQQDGLQSNNETDLQTNRQTDKQTDKQTDDISAKVSNNRHTHANIYRDIW